MVPQSTHTKHSILRCFQQNWSYIAMWSISSFIFLCLEHKVKTCKLKYPMTHMRRLAVTNKLHLDHWEAFARKELSFWLLASGWKHHSRQYSFPLPSKLPSFLSPLSLAGDSPTSSYSWSGSLASSSDPPALPQPARGPMARPSQLLPLGPPWKNVAPGFPCQTTSWNRPPPSRS